MLNLCVLIYLTPFGMNVNSVFLNNGRLPPLITCIFTRILADKSSKSPGLLRALP